MTPIVLGTGLAPDVTMVDGLVYVAYGTRPDALVLVVLTRDGVEVRRESFTAGFFNSFPRFGGPWLAYKRNLDWRPAAIDVLNGQTFTFQGQADGNYGIAVNDALGLVAYQWGAGYPIWFGSLLDGSSHSSMLTGAPDGLDTFVDMDHVTLRKDTRTSVPGLFYPVRAGDLIVGELPDLALGAPPRGAGVQLPGDELRAAFGHQDAPTPRCATDGEVYAIVTGGPLGVRLLLATAATLRTLPLASSIGAPIQPPTPTPAPVPLPPTPTPTPRPTPGPTPVPPPSPPLPKEHEMPKTPPPSFDQWIKHDYPQVRATYVAKQKHAPTDEWAAFQTERYYAFWIGLGEYWPLDRMLKEEAAPGSTSQADYPFPGSAR